MSAAHRWIRHVGSRALASWLVALTLLAAAISPASATELREPDSRALQVSLDGFTWTGAITTPLFDPDVRWVPGDVRTAQFFVRNRRPEAGDLRVVLERPLREALLGTGFLTIAARADNGPWLEVASGGRQVLVGTADIGSGGAMSVQLRASMGTDAPNQTMVLDTDLDLQVTLTQAGVVEGDSGGGGGGKNGGGDGGDGGGGGANGGTGGTGRPGASGPTAPSRADGVLPDTGSTLHPWVLPVALLLLGTGAVLAARRRDEDDEPEPQEALMRP